MITSKQRAYLRGIAQNLQPIFQIGKNGVNDNQIEQLKSERAAQEEQFKYIRSIIEPLAKKEI